MSILPDNNDSLAQNIDKGASLCVKCGLCLPHCPTYQVAKNENESPRGRIALMQGAIREQVPVTKKLVYHLDTCLACRACEAVCPAHVPYEELITSTRAWLNIKKWQKPLWIESFLIFVFERPKIRKILGNMLKFFSAFNRKSISLSSATPTKGRVLLLSSCANSVFDQQLAKDAKTILMHLGFAVQLPAPQYCCGALALHAGKLNEAQNCAQQQISQWQETPVDYIVTLTNGCHAAMQDYANAPLNLTVPKIPLLTIEAFLLQELNNQHFSANIPAQNYIVHTPCTLRNAIRQPNVTLSLLQKIPNATCIPLPVNISGCCGAAGTYFLRHKEIAEQLVSPIVTFTQQQKANAFITTNIGCAMHIHTALKEAKIEIPLLHAVSVIAKSLS